MVNGAKSKPRIRPLFVPSSIDFERLPEDVKQVFETIIGPVYEELVLEPECALERAGGATFVFWLMEELLRQLDLGGSLNFSRKQSDAQREDREKAVVRCLRVSAAKERALGALVRLRKFARTRSKRLSFSLGE